MKQLTEEQKLWVNALKSGEYSQCTGNIQDSTGFCCLGVACDLYEKQTGNYLKKNSDFELVGGTLYSHSEVQEWLGLYSDAGGFIKGVYEGSSLAKENDNGKSFIEIATLIEAQSEALFK